jgi:hypothetical protein
MILNNKICLDYIYGGVFQVFLLPDSVLSQQNLRLCDGLWTTFIGGAFHRKVAYRLHLLVASFPVEFVGTVHRKPVLQVLRPRS